MCTLTKKQIEQRKIKIGIDTDPAKKKLQDLEKEFKKLQDNFQKQYTEFQSLDENTPKSIQETIEIISIAENGIFEVTKNQYLKELHLLQLLMITLPGLT